MHDTRVYLKSKTADTATVAGYGVIFGGTDLDGETFGADTDFMLDLVPQKPVLYDHAMRKLSDFMGTVTKILVDDVGLWVESELDRHVDYVDGVLKLAEMGALGYSSGSIGHLTRREGKSIKRWPIVEFSLTPTPAEPRTVGVERIKSILADHPELAQLLPEAGGESAVEETSQDANIQRAQFLTLDILEVELS